MFSRVTLLQRDPDDRIRVLDEEGSVVDDEAVPDLDDEGFLDIYRGMCLFRRFDARAVSLQRQGRMGTFPPLSGQEAAQVASAYALDDEDWLFPSYREHAAAGQHGMPMWKTLLYWMGNERGNVAPDEVQVFPVAVPIATQILHATGAAWASRLSGDRAAFLCQFGDGATSEGDFHEGLNFAGVFDVPAIFFCNNNQWAISVPRERQTASATIAEKAAAYGFEGVQVDGMDPLAVYTTARAAVEAAKADSPPEGTARPTLIEAVMYRFGAHTTADDPTVYREDAEVERWKRLDPIPRLENFLRNTGRLDDEAVDAVEAEIEERIDEAVETAESHPRPHPEELFEYVYSDLPPHLERQREALEALRETHGDEAFLNE